MRCGFQTFTAFTCIHAVFQTNPARLPPSSNLLLPTAAKSRQKGPLEGNALHPIIMQILQVVCTCSRQSEAALNKLNRLPWRLTCKIHLITGDP
jgi:hypothetical protein